MCQVKYTVMVDLFIILIMLIALAIFVAIMLSQKKDTKIIYGGDSSNDLEIQNYYDNVHKDTKRPFIEVHSADWCPCCRDNLPRIWRPAEMEFKQEYGFLVQDYSGERRDDKKSAPINKIPAIFLIDAGGAAHSYDEWLKQYPEKDKYDYQVFREWIISTGAPKQ